MFCANAELTVDPSRAGVLSIITYGKLGFFPHKLVGKKRTHTTYEEIFFALRAHNNAVCNGICGCSSKIRCF